MTFCPDCEQPVPAEEFVAHREAEHPPTLMFVTVPGIESDEAVHGQEE